MPRSLRSRLNRSDSLNTPVEPYTVNFAFHNFPETANPVVPEPIEGKIPVTTSPTYMSPLLELGATVNENIERCKWCGRAEHQRRSHKDCGMRILRNTSDRRATCPWCHREGHTRRNHLDCALNPINQPSEQPSPTPIVQDFPNASQSEATAETLDSNVIVAAVVCPFCGIEGHQRRSHYNCAENPLRTGAIVPFLMARNSEAPEANRNDLGGMDALCSKCGAYMWIDERKQRTTRASPTFQICCQDGQAILKPVHHFPELIVNLLSSNDDVSKEFKSNIRAYNSALSFTSMNATLDQSVANNQNGAYAFRIHGSVYHLMSSTLMPANDTRPKFAQMYIFDGENELQNRLNVAGNPNMERTTMRLLQNMMH
ncbi:uncharacterized protein ATC70_007827 [Mucor velutinosus]|uniref:Helitron helicase-like domain-containing protein n=1 Tax=Mucor velutinosus TaxID=708070 RepID=A0AAN7D7W8_9FUNG|nr:hypothetical protein ATC70_007827 [Mucor velutinosus]